MTDDGTLYGLRWAWREGAIKPKAGGGRTISRFGVGQDAFMRQIEKTHPGHEWLRAL